MVLQQQTFVQTMAASATTAVVSVTNIYADHGSVYASTDAIAKAASCKFCACTTCGTRISSFGILSDKYSEPGEVSTHHRHQETRKMRRECLC